MKNKIEKNRRKKRKDPLNILLSKERRDTTF